MQQTGWKMDLHFLLTLLRGYAVTWFYAPFYAVTQLRGYAVFSLLTRLRGYAVARLRGYAVT